MRGMLAPVLLMMSFASLLNEARADEPPKSTKDDPVIIDAKTPNKRGRRNLRWTLTFGPSTAKDYLEKAAKIGMYLVVPSKEGNPLQVADLEKRPAKLMLADIRDFKRNWFTDDNKESCASVAEELKLDFVPIALLFFYPYEFEEALLKKELEFKGLKEEQIKSTKFKITFKDDKPVIEVVEQAPFEAKKP